VIGFVTVAAVPPEPPTAVPHSGSAAWQ
jgi:hypothetical protein